jgi:LysM repeat protein
LFDVITGTVNAKNASEAAALPATERNQQCRQPIQCKLSIGAVDDPLEHEADAMADTVMRMPEPFTSFSSGEFQGDIQRNSLSFGEGRGEVQRKCAHCDEEDQVQMKPLAASITPFIQAKGAQGGIASDGVTQQINTTKGSGSPMDRPTQSFMESRFGTDFSGVKIHTGDDAVQMSRELNAQAFTVGSDIYFNSGKYNPSSESGKHLLAHELTHTVQQGAAVARKIQKRDGGDDPIHGPILDRFSAETGIPRDMANAHSPEYENWIIGSPALSSLGQVTGLASLLDAANLLTVTQLRAARAMLPLSTIPNINLVSIAVRAALLCKSPADVNPAQSASLLSDMNALPAAQSQRVSQFINAHQSRASLAPDLMGTTAVVTPLRHANIDAVLNPGASVSSSGVVTAPTPSAGCADGTYATQMRAAVVPLIHSRASAFNALRANPPALPIASMGPIANVAQQEVENRFRPYLNATTTGGSGFALGSSTAASLIQDQSTTTQWQNQAGRRGWVQYWMNTDGESVNNTHHCGSAVFNTVKEGIADDPALQTDIDAAVQSWPAEATNGIHMQPYVAASQLRSYRWDVFTTIIHEYIHVLRHPNFTAAQRQVNPSGLQILKEGIDDLLRHDVWDSTAGNLEGRVAQPAYAPNRLIIEGASYPFDATQVVYHPDYPQLREARQIETEVGINNIKAAYFLGQVELIGLGQGTLTNSTGNLANIGMWTTADATENDIVSVLPGETLAQLRNRFNATNIQTTAGAALPVVSPLPAQVKIPGVRTVVVLSGQSLAHIANINGVTVFELMRANNLSSAANPAVGTKLKIPLH